MKKTQPDILEQANKRYDACLSADNENFTNARADLKFLNGDHWPEDAKKLRKAERRPCLTINKLPAFVRQITNDQRQNRPSIHVHPVDDDADRDVANILEGMIRHIEYDSDAASCYDTSVHLATASGRGFFRLITDYESPESFDQVIKFDRIRNACSVHLDPSSKCPAGSDARFCFVDSSAPASEIAAASRSAHWPTLRCQQNRPRHKAVHRPSPPASPPDHASTFPLHADPEARQRLPPTTVARLEYPDSPSP